MQSQKISDDMSNAITSLKRKECEFNGKYIDISYPFFKGKLGNKSYGKLDFLISQGMMVFREEHKLHIIYLPKKSTNAEKNLNSKRSNKNTKKI
jgi:hypothetical protein